MRRNFISEPLCDWQKADAQALPFPNIDCRGLSVRGDVLPGQQNAYREARRVMKPGGRFIFNVWDKIEHNGFADLVTRAGLLPRLAPRLKHAPRSVSSGRRLSIAPSWRRGKPRPRPLARSPAASHLRLQPRARSPRIRSI